MKRLIRWFTASELRRIYVHLCIDAFAVTLINLFIPIYLYSIGFELSQVMLYLLIMWSLIGIGAPLYAKIISSYGVIRLMIVSDTLLAIEFLLLRQLEFTLWLQDYMLLMALIGGVSGGFYFMSLQLLFTTYLGAEKHHEKTGIFMAMPKLGIMIGPGVGGIVAATVGFAPLFVLSISMLFLSLVPLIRIANKSLPKYSFSFTPLISLLGWKSIHLVLYGIKSSMVFMILPLALFLSKVDIVTVGAVLSGIMVLEALCSVGVGKLSDKWGGNKLIKIGGVLMAALLGGLGYFYGSPILAYLAIIAGILSSLIAVPFEATMYSLASKQKNPLDFIVFKELCFSLGRILVFGSVIVFTQMDSAFYLGALASFLFIFF